MTPKILNDGQFAFRQRLSMHLERTRLTQADLAARARIPESQISAWFKGDRRIGQEPLGRVAFALAERYAEINSDSTVTASSPDPEKTRRGRPPNRPGDGHVAALDEIHPYYRGPEDLVALLADLVSLAGDQFGDDRQDLVWRRMSGRQSPHVLRVGWYEKYPLAYTHRGEFQGIAKQVTERVASLLAARIEWVRLELPALTDKLRTGAIDLVCCEYVGVESIGFHVWLSDPMPILRICPVGLVSTTLLPAVVRVEDLVPGAHSVDWPEFDRMRFCHTNTLIGKALHSSLLPRAAMESQWASDERAPEALSTTLLECCKNIVDTPRDSSGRIRCFATDTLTFFEARRSLGDSVSILPPMPNEPLPRFGLCFALHPSEGDRFGQMLNRAIATLDTDMNYFEFVLQSNSEWLGIHRDHQILVDKLRRAGTQFLSAHGSERSTRSL